MVNISIIWLARIERYVPPVGVELFAEIREKRKKKLASKGTGGHG